MKAIGYALVSTDGQAEKGISLAAQQSRIRAMATLQETELTEVIVDAGDSGKNRVRPGMQRLLALIERREVDAVIIAKLDRLTRSVKDLANLLELFEHRGIHLLSVAESLDTGSAAGRLVMNIMASLAQWEREVIGERTKEARGHKKARMEFVGNCPHGFRLRADGMTAEPDPAEQRVRKTITRLREQGRSLRHRGVSQQGTSLHPQRVAVDALLRGEGVKGNAMEEDDMTPQHVLLDSLETVDFHVDRGGLTANLKLVVCGRPESLALFVEPLGDEIGVEVDEAVLDCRALTVVANHVAAKLNAPEGKSALKQAAEGSKQHRRWLPQAVVPLSDRVLRARCDPAPVLDQR